MDNLATTIYIVCAVGNLCCLGSVIGKMFENDMKDLAMISIVLVLLCFTGVLLVFGSGWFYSRQWNCRGLMWVWTCFLATQVLLTASAVLF